MTCWPPSSPTSDSLRLRYDELPPITSRTHLSHLKAYYTAVRALTYGPTSNRQLGLPTELVLSICRLADFHWLDPRYTTEQNTDMNPMSFLWFRRERQICIESPVVDRWFLRHAKSVQLVTESNHREQSDVQRPFEVGVYSHSNSAELQPKKQRDGSLASWMSHFSHEASQGELFAPNHRIWDYIALGDVIVASVDIKPFTIDAPARRGRLEVTVWWEPSAVMLGMMRRVDEGMRHSQTQETSRSRSTSRVPSPTKRA